MPDEHTPGPWRVGNLAPSFGVRTDDGHDDYFGAAFSNVWGDGPDGEPVGVARCVHRGDPGLTVANARLIAAAPSLLAACETLMGMLEDAGVTDTAGYAKARAAVGAARPPREDDRRP